MEWSAEETEEQQGDESRGKTETLFRTARCRCGWKVRREKKAMQAKPNLENRERASAALLPNG